MKKKKAGFLDDATYALVLASVPIPTVDFVVMRGKGAKREFLLVKRNESPYKGEYFIPGGRILKGEPMEHAVHRVLERELGIVGGVASFAFCRDTFNPPKMGIRWHSIWHVHFVRVFLETTIRLNPESARALWFKRIGRNWPVPVQETLEGAGFDY